MNDLHPEMRVIAEAELDILEDVLHGRRSRADFCGEYISMSELIRRRQHLRDILDKTSKRRPMGQSATDSSDSHLPKENIMHIEFEDKIISTKLTFRMVKPGQMFLDDCGGLFQKSISTYDEAWCLANCEGYPQGYSELYFDQEEITFIYPDIRKIQM